MRDMSVRKILAIAAFLILQASYSVTIGGTHPEQIHLSLGNSPQEMMVTWTTFVATGSSYVWYGDISEGLALKVEGYSTEFKGDEDSGVVRYIHRVIIPYLKPNTFYVYRCGSAYGMSEVCLFKMPPSGTNWSPRLIIYGDMGWKGAAVFPFVQNEAKDYDVDAIVHVGDIAYNMDSLDGFVGDQFLRMIQPLASSVPYMTTVGNHEQNGNFSHYKNRFSMPGRSDGLFYSFDLGPAHFVVISTEVYYFTEYGIEPLINQYNWLQEDLKRAARIANRLERPWIVVFGHRPMYCSSDVGEDCSLESNILKYCPINGYNYGLEYLFHEYKVDLVFSGHMHYYERSWPIFNNLVFNGSCDEPYRNARATVHITTGAAGMKCGTESASYIRHEWFPFFSSENSYTVLSVKNKSHLQVEQVSASQGGEIIDSVWLTKDSPCS